MSFDWSKDAIRILRGRTYKFDFYLFLGDGVTPEALQAGDVVRFKMGESGSTPILDLDETPLSGGSRTEVLTLGTAGSVPAKVRVWICQADTASITAGTYDGELLLVDDDETNPADAAEPIIEGQVIVKVPMGGDLGLT